MIHIAKYISLLIAVLAVLSSGCVSQQLRSKSSVVDYLYPEQSKIIVEPSIPVLNIPVKVGIAFVPEQATRSRGFDRRLGSIGENALTEAKKADLLEKVAENFRKYKFVSDIEVIPSAYLTAGGGFKNLNQIRTMYGIDIIALVSHDQVQFTDEGFLSLTYQTLVGAYVFSGEKNDTSTMLDTAVYDIKSQKMLFRAPGTSNVQGKSTPVNLSEELRADSVKSFEEAADKMISNLDLQLAKFRKKIKRNPEKVKVFYSQSYSGGGGSIGLLSIGAMLMFPVLLFRNREEQI